MTSARLQLRQRRFFDQFVAPSHFHQQRANVAKLLGPGHCLRMRSILIQLIRDLHPPVRLEAARNIAKLAARTPVALSAELARHIAHFNGMYLPRALLGVWVPEMVSWLVGRRACIR